MQPSNISKYVTVNAVIALTAFSKIFLINCQLIIIIVTKNDTSKNKNFIISTNIIVFESMEVQ